MADYATIADVKARLAGRPISPTSQPSEADITAWIGEAEAMLDGALKGADLPAPYSDADAVRILRAWVCDRVVGLTRMALASAGGDGQNDDGKDMVAKFDRLVDDIQRRPTVYGAMLAAGNAPAGSVRFRGANRDGALKPVFDRDEVF